MLVHIIKVSILIFFNIWPDDGLFRPKLVADIRNMKFKKVVSEGVHILFHFDIVL